MAPSGSKLDRRHVEDETASPLMRAERMRAMAEAAAARAQSARDRLAWVEEQRRMLAARRAAR